jgi:hypothetical protein
LRSFSSHINLKKLVCYSRDSKFWLPPLHATLSSASSLPRQDPIEEVLIVGHTVLRFGLGSILRRWPRWLLSIALIAEQHAREDACSSCLLPISLGIAASTFSRAAGGHDASWASDDSRHFHVDGIVLLLKALFFIWCHE